MTRDLFVRYWRLSTSFVILFGVTLVYIGISLIDIQDIGLHYDEVFWSNAAFGIIDESFIFKKISTFPILLLPYVGALKAYLYYPIFKFFGASVYTVRVPAVFISAISLLLYFKFTKKFFDKKAAFILIVILASDPTFIYFSKLDFGPVVLAHLLKATVLISFFSWLDTKNSRFAVIAIGSVLLGIFNKLDFVWFVNALGISYLVLHVRMIKSAYEKANKTILGVAGTLVVFLGLYIVWMSETFYSETFIFDFNFGDRVAAQLSNLTGTFNAKTIFWLITGERINVGSILLYSIVLALFLVCVREYYGRERSVFNSRYKLIILTSLIIFIQIFITSHASGPHHILMLYPLPHILMAVILSSFLQAYSGEPQHLARCYTVVGYSLIFAILLFNFLTLQKFIGSIRENRLALMV